MTEKEKAGELIWSFRDFVNPYIGSGMLSNSYDDRAILMQCKSCALVTIDNIFTALSNFAAPIKHIGSWEETNFEQWKRIKKIVENYTSEEYLELIKTKENGK